MLCFPPPLSDASPDAIHSHMYSTQWTPKRWLFLADTFTYAYNQLLDMSTVPLLHIALSSGMSALKTPACHRDPTLGRRHRPGRDKNAPKGQLECPICSTDLHELSRNLPNAQHTQSHIEPEQMLLPNGNVYSRTSLLERAAKAGHPGNVAKDPRNGDMYPLALCKKVFVS